MGERSFVSFITLTQTSLSSFPPSFFFFQTSTVSNVRLRIVILFYGTVHNHIVSTIFRSNLQIKYIELRAGPYECQRKSAISSSPTESAVTLSSESTDYCVRHTDKKEHKIFLIHKEIQKRAVAKSYLTKGLLINDKIFAHFLIY